ncbi:MAG: biotin/lipoyl-binding protein, partial [Duncaniella sp.]|nr:biotin/lipoyl-binding protein [Duncaniella sp.]
MKLHSTIILALLLAATSCSKEQSISLVTQDVTRGSISETVTATGTIESETSVDVGTQVTGIIDKILVDFNSQVKKGELLAEIDKVLLQSELTSAEANVNSAKASYEYAKPNYERDKALHPKKLI